MIVDQNGNKLAKGDQIGIVMGPGLYTATILETNEDGNAMVIGVMLPTLPNRPHFGIIKAAKTEAT